MTFQRTDVCCDTVITPYDWHYKKRSPILCRVIHWLISTQNITHHFSHEFLIWSVFDCFKLPAAESSLRKKKKNGEESNSYTRKVRAVDLMTTHCFQTRVTWNKMFKWRHNYVENCNNGITCNTSTYYVIYVYLELQEYTEHNGVTKKFQTGFKPCYIELNQHY